MPYRVVIRNLITGEEETVDDEVYENEDEAYAASVEASSNFSAGAEVLELANEDYEDPKEYEFDIEEI